MAERPNIIPFLPAPFVPSISYGGSEPLYWIRGANWWLRSKSTNTMYASAYKGSKNINEPIPVMTLTGTLAWNAATDDRLITGTSTLFRKELKPGSFVLATGGAEDTFFVVEEVISDTQIRVSVVLEDSVSGYTGSVLPILFAMGTKRATQIRGNTIRYPRGHLLGVGQGELRLNGQPVLVSQIEKIEIVGSVGPSGGGTLAFTVTAAGMTGSPKNLNVNVANNDTSELIAGKAAAAMVADADIGHLTTGFFDVWSTGANLYFRKKQGATNDVTMNIGYALGTATGPTAVPSSTTLVEGGKFALTQTPKYAIYDPITETYTEEDFGVTLPEDIPSSSPLISLSAQNGGVKGMLAGVYSIRVVAVSDQNTGGTGGYSQPSETVKVTITAGQKIRITFNQPMHTLSGHNAYDLYVSKYDSTDEVAVNGNLGPWFLYERVTAADLADHNSAADGRVAGLTWDVEFADGELESLNRMLSFDNFEAYEAEYVDLIASEQGFTPVFFSCLGRSTVTQEMGTSPGPSIAVGKPDNPEALMRDKAVSTFEGDTILGVVGVRGRHWLLCENSMQTAILTGVAAAPMTTRSFWDIGFRNPFNIRFVKDYIFGHSTGGFIRSIGVGDTSDIDFEFSMPVDDYTVNWQTSHILTASDPRNKAVCFFFSGYDKSTGYYKTLVLPFLPHQNIWNPPMILEGLGQSVTNTVVGTAGASTNIVVTVTADGMSNSPKAINVAVVNGDNATTIAGKIRTALGSDVDVSAFFNVIGSGASYGLSVKTRAEADSTMNLTHGSISGVAASGAALTSWVAIQDFIVSGTATVGSSLYFLAGGRKGDGSIGMDTYQFDKEDGVPVECYAAWAFTDLAEEEVPSAVRGVASFIGHGSNIKVEVHGMPSNGIIDPDDLDTGHSDAIRTVFLGDSAGLGRIEEKRQNFQQYSKFTCRLSLDSVNGSGRFDELNILVTQGAGSRK